MASTSRLENVNPNSVFFAALLASFAFFAFSIISVIHLSSIQNARLVHYELAMLLRSHGSSIRLNHFRDFVQTADLDKSSLNLWVVNTLDSSRFEYLGIGQTYFQQCSNENYFQYDVTFCRPTLLPWSYLNLITGFYLIILFLAVWVLNQLNKSIARSFRHLFQMAALPHPEPLTFPVAWRYAIQMAERFKDFQRQSVDFAKAQTMSQIASQLAHDIRSPLSALNMVAATFTEVSQEKRDMLKMISKRINDIANDLLQNRKSAYQKFEQNNLFAIHKNPETVDLANLLEEVVAEKRLQYSEKTGIEINLWLNREKTKPIQVHKVGMARAISNLLNNAIEALSADGGKIRISLDLYNGIPQLLIEDDGIGMPQEILSKLGREGFSQGKSGVDSGSGLGFFQVVQAIDQSGGNIRVDSAVGKGTIVTIRF